jgi:hypothetical protein
MAFSITLMPIWRRFRNVLRAVDMAAGGLGRELRRGEEEDEDG